MGKRATSAEAAAGILPKNDQRPPFFAFAVSLYRSDLLFRGLVDLAISGFAILVFTGGLTAAWQPVKSTFESLIGAFSRPTSEIRVSDPNQLTTQAV
jgi:hypothetical protein